MYYLCYHRREPDLHQEIIPELKLFFTRIQQIRRTLNRNDAVPYLNRIQRERCKNNLFAFERTAREFHAIDNRDDFLHLYRQLQRYMGLKTDDLRRILGEESTRQVTLFMHYG